MSGVCLSYRNENRMKHATTEGIDAYRIGYGRLWKFAARRRLHAQGITDPKAFWHVSVSRPTSDRWRRCWQAEWTGCQRAPRAWTKAGVTRKAKRWQWLRGERV